MVSSNFREGREIARDGVFVVLEVSRRTDGAPFLLRRPIACPAPPAIAATLRRERALFAEVTGPGIPRPVDGQHEDALLLEPFDGTTLRALQCAGRLPLARVLRIGLGIARALGVLHAARIATRGLSPETILAGPDDRVLLLDFSRATRLPQERQSPGPLHALRARLAYLAPEETGRMNRDVDTRAELYAFGVILYELLCGRPPFVSDDPLELVHWQIALAPVAPAELDPQIPRPVSEIVLALLAKTPEERYQAAQGVVRDLSRALDALDAHGRIDPFPLSVRETGARFAIPQQLFGREAELARLSAAFERVREGACTLVLVSGYSGIGKTSLVQEIHKPIVRARGRYSAGKFDQLDRSVPYGALIGALRGLVLQLLAEDEDAVAEARARLTTALGPLAGVITAVIPVLEGLIGPQPAPPPLAPAEAQNRFGFAFQAFVGALARREHPLVLFLDDLQWADAATLALLPQLLTNPDVRYLALIGAYRDNEVGPDHPLARALRAVGAAGASIDELTLAPLRLQDVQALVAGALAGDHATAADLAGVAMRKTAGNPFFLNRFLIALHDAGLIRFDPATGAFAYDTEGIERAELTDNVVDLMTGSLRRLSPATAQAVTLGACIGNTFSLETLAVVREATLTDTAAALWPAIAAGLLLPLDPRYEQIVAGGEDLLRESAPSFRFLHDRVQQAAYALIAAADRRAVHLRVGRLLRARCGDAIPPARLFEIAGHLNIGRTLIDDTAEIDDLARIDLAAGRKARESAAFGAALAYFDHGRALGVADARLSRALELDAAECEYLCGRFEDAERSLDRYLAAADDPVERADAARVRIVQCENLARYTDAVHAGRAALAAFGVVFPEDADGKLRGLARELDAIEALRAGREIGALRALPSLDDARVRAVMKLLTAMWAPAYIAPDGPLTALISATMVRLSLAHGNCAESAYGYVTHAITVGTARGDHRAGHAWGLLAIDVNDRFADVTHRAKVRHMFSCFVNLWRRTLRSCIPYAREAHRVGIESGDMVYATYAVFHETWYALLAGDDITAFDEECATSIAFLRRIRNDSFADAQQLIRHWGRALAGRTEAPGMLRSADFDDGAYEHRYAENGFFQTFLWIVRLSLHVVFGETGPALAAAERARGVASSLAGTIWPVLLEIFEGLAHADALRTAGPGRREAHDEQLASCAGRLARAAADAPENFAAYRHLLAAEQAAGRGEIVTAIAGYEAALDAAAVSESAWAGALALERFGAFWKARGSGALAAPLLAAARDAYARWGAEGKVDDIERRGEVELPPRRDPEPAGRPAVDFAQFDLETARRAARAITSEIEMDRLVTTLVRLAIENAGAERGVLVREQDGALLAVARGVVGAPVRVAQPPEPLATCTDLCVPMVQLVQRSGQSLLVADALADPEWSTDGYVATSRPRSVLCVPILHQGAARGVLYLEHRLGARTFDPARIETVRFLAGEAGIALENARLYEAMRAEATRRRRAEEALRDALGELEDLKNRLQRENVYLQEEIRTEHNFQEIVGNSPALLAALRAVEQVAATNATVLILGETGTGKELFARAIHDRSRRKDRPLVKVNCGAIAAGLVESELFGHVKGAFTGALVNRTGRFELAHGGTLFLDEVGELPLDTQVKLLRVLQEQEFEPVGSARTVRVDVRVIAATNRDLHEAVRAGSFRRDLLYRLNVFPLQVAPLRERAGDVPLLAAFFLGRAAKRLGREVTSFSRATMQRMREYPWPGNVRELQNLVERAAILATGPVVEIDPAVFSTGPVGAGAVAGARSGGHGETSRPARTLEDVEREHIVATLRTTGGIVEGPRGAARLLGLHPNTLRSRMKKLSIVIRAPRSEAHDIS